MKALDRAAILAADDLPIAKVRVPQWGGIVYVRSMTGKERDAFEAEQYRANVEHGDPLSENMRARLVVLCLVDKDGKREFSDSDEDIELVGAKSAASLDLVFSAAAKLNGLSSADVEELAGN